MFSLGQPSIEVETLEQRIERRLNDALDRQVAADLYAYDPDDRGLAVRTPGAGGPLLRLSMADVARIAAAEARDWF
jgi:hypothetical protein